MINMTIKRLLETVKGELFSHEENPDLSLVINSVTIDSRSCQDNSLFVAFKGEHVDGHDFLSLAQNNGAVIALVETIQYQHKIIQIKVDDVLQAMAHVARICRLDFKGPVVGITGSCGKTSVKEMLKSILTISSSVSVTQGNQNNEIGVPLTLLALQQEQDYAIVEMGAAQQGDISYLMSMVQPDVSVISNVRAAHVGRFGSEDFIAIGKSEIYRDLAPGKIAVINLDEKYAQQWLLDINKQQTLTFSINDKSADLYADEIELLLEQTEFTLCYQGQSQHITIYAPGIHNVHNALAAAACAIAVNTNLEDVQQGLKLYTGVNSRLQQLSGVWGGRLIDDCYNANPGSVKAAIDVLKEYPTRKVLVLADMEELGDQSIDCHKNVGDYALEQGVDLLLSFGKNSRYASQTFGENSQHFTDKKILLNFLNTELMPNDVLLVKGSRSAAMEEIIQPLLNQGQG